MATVNSAEIAIIGGTSLLTSTHFQDYGRIVLLEDENATKSIFGYQSKCGKYLFIQRHMATGKDADTYCIAPCIDYVAIGKALKLAGVKKVLSITSVGSLQTKITPGTIVIPDDYFALFTPVWCNADATSHFMPTLNTPLRKHITHTLQANNIQFLDGGVYAQACGPRFETKAECRFLSTVGDIVGMTGGSEFTVLQELGFDYAMISCVDNYCTSILLEGELTMEKFYASVAKNKSMVEKIIEVLMPTFA